MLQEILTKLTEVWELFTVYAKSNPVIAGIAGLWGVAVVTFFLRTIPSRVIDFIVRQSTTTLHLNSRDYIFYDLLRWISKNKTHSFVRTLNFNNGKDVYHRSEARSMITVGYGTIFFTFEGRLFLFSREEIAANQTSETKERITITVVGRTHEPFKALFREIQAKVEEDQNYIRVYTWDNGDWCFANRQFKRDLNTIIIDPKAKDSILKHIDNFHNDKKWYADNGVPYRTGMLFSGPPGTGKTSLIKGLCSYYDKHLYILTLNSMSDKTLQKALSDVPENCIVAIEDIDAYGVNLKRNPVKDPLEDNEEEAEEKERLGLTMAGLLNAIDGVISAENRILIATTNYPEKIDPALLREGRFDLKLKIDYMSTDMFKVYMKRFYPTFEVPEDFKLKEKTAPCEVQKLVFENRNTPEQVLEKLNGKT